MPRERVQDQAGMFDVHVGWNPGSSVQVGVETADHRALVDRLAGEHANDPEVRAALDKLLGDAKIDAFTGVWGTLDREGCNRLIRLLRNARDKAYGRDE